MRRIAALAYGILVYVLFLAVFLYLVAFVGDLGTPTALDGVPRSPWPAALAVDLLLLGAFAVQHSVMARGAFKRRITRVIPESVERSTFVLASTVVLAALAAFWQPIAGEAWHAEAPWLRAVLWALFAAGWGMVLASTFLIDHFDLFGLRQVVRYARGLPYEPPRFVTPWLYRRVRHPIYTGFLLAFWATPRMTVGHLVFAAAASAYIVVAARLFEERDLERAHGEAYARYRAQVPMLVPRPGKGLGSGRP